MVCRLMKRERGKGIEDTGLKKIIFFLSIDNIIWICNNNKYCLLYRCLLGSQTPLLKWILLTGPRGQGFWLRCSGTDQDGGNEL